MVKKRLPTTGGPHKKKLKDKLIMKQSPYPLHHDSLRLLTIYSHINKQKAFYKV